MNKVHSIIFLAFIVVFMIPQCLFAQSYKYFSRYAGGSALDEVNKLQVVNGESYVLGVTSSSNFPVTNGTTYKGLTDLTLTKYDANGNVIFATYLGGNYSETVTAMLVVNGEVYLTGFTESNTFPVTNGSVYKGAKDAFVTKFNSNGTLAFSTFVGGTRAETPTVNALHIIGNELIFTGTTASLNFPVTNNSIYSGGSSDIFITKLNATNGSILFSSLYGGNNTEDLVKTEFDNNAIYLIGSTNSTNLPVSIGSPINDTLINGFVIKVSPNDLHVLYARYLGGDFASNFITVGEAVNGSLHVSGYTYSSYFPVTNGGQSSLGGLDYADGFYTRLDSNGVITYSTYLSSPDLDGISDMIISNGEVYLAARWALSPYNGEKKVILFKLNTSGDIIYSKNLSLGFGGFVNPGSFQVVNGDFFISGICQGANFPVTNGSQFYPGTSGFFTRFDPNGNLLFSTFLGKLNSLLPIKYSNNKFYLLGNTDIRSFPITDTSEITGGNDNILFIKNLDGTDVFSGFVGGNNNESPAGLEINGNDIYLAGKTSSDNYPVTNTVLYKGNADQFITKISFCPNKYFVLNDTLSPKTQSACRFGLAQKITGAEIIVPSDSLPALYLNGISTQQANISANYQWQSSGNSNGPWSNIPSAIFKDYTPSLDASSKFFRRLSFTSTNCGSELIHISDTASVIANQLTAPTINPAGPFITCPGSPIPIGGSPTVSGGNPPYTNYLWDNAVPSVANPVVTTNTNTIFTLIVTDALGCRQIGQEVVLTYRAEAGPDRGACGGNAVQIGGLPIPGLSAAIYGWQPSAGLTATNIAQPFANPSLTTDYSLILTIPKSNGETCITKDTVRVKPVSSPPIANFAGPDRVLCLSDSTSLGTTAQSGFNYVWSPGSYITSNTTSRTFYYPGNIVMPVPNPAALQVTAQKDGCSFPDETIVSTIEARAGLDGCGPRLVGLPDRTPDINEIYSWTKISGPGNFTGPTNLPQVSVSASVGAPTIYQLTVSYNGNSCSDLVSVPGNCSGCLVTITVDAKYQCPGYDVNGGSVRLTALSSNPNAVFSWTPTVGLTNYTGSIVQLTDNVPRIYTVTATDIIDSSIQCAFNIFVNDPAFSRPVFPAPDTATCIGIPVSIGLPPVAGYNYLWTGSGLSSNLTSNPIATVSAQTAYPVKITDGNGCELKDTVLVNVQNAQVNAGPDWVICSSGIVKLGTAAQPNTNYLWEPQSSPWQNGTNQFSAQPEVFIATNINFIVTATTSAGCITKDTVNIIVNNNPGLSDAPDKFICKGNGVVIGNPALPGVTYQWTPATGLSNPNIAQPFANPSTNTTYSVVASFPGACGSTSSDQVTVTVGNAFFSMPDISFCPANGAFPLGNSAPTNMITYNWQPQQLVSNATIANPTTLNTPPNTTTQFTLLVTDQNGCQYRDTILIIPTITIPDAGVDKTICKGQSTLLGSSLNNTSTGISYNWNPTTNLSDPLSPNPVFTGLTGGTFTYTLTKSDNIALCSATDAVIIKVIDLTLPVINGNTVCHNSCVQIGTPPVQGLQYQWTPSEGLSNPNISNPQACVASTTTSYTLTASDVNGCSISTSVVIGVHPLPAAQITIPDVTACLGDSNLVFTPVINPAGNYSYLWSPNNGTLSNIYSQTPEITTTGPGNSQFSLLVTDTVTGCSNSATANLFVTICPDLAIVGDYLWFDVNANGIQDTDELGVSGMNVQLFNSANFNVATTVTDTSGFYQFINVPAGNDYYVIFEKPLGYDFTVQNIGGIGADNNSKADINGRSNNFNIPPGANILNIDAGIITACGGPVPVGLLNFTATLINREVHLHWQTTAEFNNDYFIVERSIDGINFYSIGTVDGNGTTVVPHNYSLTDLLPVNGINYYRLKQVDFDRLFTYSNIKTIEIRNNEMVTVFYSPQNNSIKVNFSEEQEDVQWKLFGANGQLIRSEATKQAVINYLFKVPVLSNGVYILQILNKHITYSKKIFINN